MRLQRFTVLFIGLLLLSGLQASTYYVATNGSDTNQGTKDAPFATIMRAQKEVVPGDTVYIRGGVYKMTDQQISAYRRIYAIVNLLYKSGTPGKYICYFAYPGEKPVIDMRQVKPANKRVMAFDVTGSWIHLKGLQVVGTQVTILTHTQSECFHNEGSHNIYEELSMHDGMAIGFYLIKGSDNLILNCDAYRNWDYLSENHMGGNTDGFGCHPRPGSKGNIFRGCRSWFNSDDGFDCIRAAQTVTFDHCWSFYNGYSTKFKRLGDGNGFKAGGWGLRRDFRVPDSIPGHIVRFCLSVDNRANGFYSNHHLVGSTWINNTAYRNGTNYNMLNRNFAFTKDIPGEGHVLINNVAFEARGIDTLNINVSKCVLSHNSFQLKSKLTKKDFVSLDEKQLTAPRKADGSLPDITFMKPSANSILVDAGKDVGFPYKGKAPDIGCFER